MDITTVKQAIIARVNELTRIASIKGLRYHEKTAHDFTLRGRCAGQYAVTYRGVTTIYPKSALRWNLEIAKNNLQEYLNTTVPHELAHAIQRYHYPHSTPHGKEWKRCCVALVGHELSRCHTFAFTPARNTNRYAYTCKCMAHSVSSVIHNRIMRGMQYRCKICKTYISIQPTLANTH